MARSLHSKRVSIAITASGTRVWLMTKPFGSLMWSLSDRYSTQICRLFNRAKCSHMLTESLFESASAQSCVLAIVRQSSGGEHDLPTRHATVNVCTSETRKVMDEADLTTVSWPIESQGPRRRPPRCINTSSFPPEALEDAAAIQSLTAPEHLPTIWKDTHSLARQKPSTTSNTDSACSCTVDPKEEKNARPSGGRSPLHFVDAICPYQPTPFEPRIVVSRRSPRLPVADPIQQHGFVPGLSSWCLSYARYNRHLVLHRPQGSKQ
nr:hypothetical protein CFP56_72403 [Quercus suber]